MFSLRRIDRIGALFSGCFFVTAKQNENRKDYQNLKATVCAANTNVVATTHHGSPRL
jgi:hypothetical protein